MKVEIFNLTRWLQQPMSELSKHYLLGELGQRNLMLMLRSPAIQQRAVSHLKSPSFLSGRWGRRRRAGEGARCLDGRGSCVSVIPDCPCDNGDDDYRGNGWGEH